MRFKALLEGPHRYSPCVRRRSLFTRPLSRWSLLLSSLFASTYSAKMSRGGDELKSYTQRKYLFRSKRQWLAVAFILPHFSRSFGHSLLDCPNKFSQLKARPLASMEMLETILSPCEAFCY